MKRSDIDVFEKLIAQLAATHQEVSALAKKSPNDAVNAFKLRLINTTLMESNKFLGERYRPFADFDVFSEENLPSISDASFIVAQYIECAEKFRGDNIHQFLGEWYWKLEDSSEDRIRTAPPRKLTRKSS